MEPERLREYLQERLAPPAELRIESAERIGGGASRETWAVDATWSEAGMLVRRRFVFRRDPSAGLLESDRRTEFEVMRAARAMSVPVPEMYWLEEDPRWLDRPFAVMQWVEGAVPSVVFPPHESAELRAAVAGQFVRLLARIHDADWRAHGLDELGAPESASAAAAEQVERWRAAYERARTEERPILALALHWLASHLPEGGEITLVHGDYRVGNVLYGEDGIRAVLDWEMAHIGDPLEDLGWATMRFWTSGGLCQGLLPRQELIAGYERERGVRVDRESHFFYEVLGSVKMAIIGLTGVKSFNQGLVADVVLAMVGYMVPRLEATLLEQLEI